MKSFLRFSLAATILCLANWKASATNKKSTLFQWFEDLKCATSGNCVAQMKRVGSKNELRCEQCTRDEMAVLIVWEFCHKKPFRRTRKQYLPKTPRIFACALDVLKENFCHISFMNTETGSMKLCKRCLLPQSTKPDAKTFVAHQRATLSGVSVANLFMSFSHFTLDKTFGCSTPSFLSNVLLIFFSHLQNWHSHGGKKCSPKSVQYCASFLSRGRGM